jgi:HSP20 family protein
MRTRSPFDDLFYVFRDLDSLFSRDLPVLGPMLVESSKLLPAGATGGSALAPAVESFTKDGKLFIRAELPGVDPTDLHVSVTGNRLQISGEKKSGREVNEADVYFREISQGRFERNFTLPQGVKTDQLTARFENGVLELSMPVPEENQVKKIPIDVVAAGKQVKAA